MAEFNSCVKCYRETTALEARFCSVCGGEMLTSDNVRKRGWAMLILGLFLASLVVWVVVWFMVSDSYFSGSEAAAILAISLGILVLAMGVVGIVGGIWQIKSGRRNKKITDIVERLRTALLLVGRAGRRMR